MPRKQHNSKPLSFQQQKIMAVQQEIYRLRVSEMYHQDRKMLLQHEAELSAKDKRNAMLSVVVGVTLFLGIIVVAMLK